MELTNERGEMTAVTMPMLAELNPPTTAPNMNTTEEMKKKKPEKTALTMLMAAARTSVTRRPIRTVKRKLCTVEPGQGQKTLDWWFTLARSVDKTDEDSVMKGRMNGQTNTQTGGKRTVKRCRPGPGDQNYDNSPLPEARRQRTQVTE